MERSLVEKKFSVKRGIKVRVILIRENRIWKNKI